ncbi:hypothetical protein SteCoe_2930 [Stentor coeruleus]|uniref:UEV domain-containing protein n=1 Tax=Stentor coeruleus TaxID=5963 RepID=A0A1R2CYD1_9CILI|nr:hypothetical protein SteCoe_2930 [Stentor coeruleus]
MINLTPIITNALTQCSYSPELKQMLHQEVVKVIQANQYLQIEMIQSQVQNSYLVVLQLRGVLPIFFKKIQYRIPVRIIYPPTYPNSPPDLYVDPSPEMIINQNNENIKPDGKVNISLIKNWKKKKNTSYELIEEAKKSFSNKIPVYSRANVSTMQSYPEQPKPQPQQPPPKQSGLLNSALNFFSESASAISRSIAPSSSNPSGPQEDAAKNGPGGTNPRFAQNLEPLSHSVPISQPANLPAAYPNISSNPPQSNSSNNKSQTFFPQLPNYSSSQKSDSGTSQTQVKNQHIDQQQVKEIYLRQIKDLKQEINMLKVEAETLDKNKVTIEKNLQSFNESLINDKGKIEMLKVCVKNTNDWLLTNSHNQPDISTLDEQDLLEYRNPFAKSYLLLLSEEKSKEATSHALIEAMNKNIIPAKESIHALKQIYIDLFMTTRLKEKVLSLSKSS